MQIILNIFVRLLQHDYLMAQKSIVTNNGKRGGNLEGKPHKNKQGQDVGGIKAVVTDANNRPVELEGGEVIINKEASKKHWRELSRINQSAGGGVPISKPVDPHDEDPEEYSKGGKIQFNPNKLPNKWILKYAQKIKENHPEIWKKGGNIYGNQAFKNLERVAERGYWLDSEEWFYIKWRSFVARHKGDFRIAGVVAMLKWVDKVDRGWQYMKNLIEDEIKKIEARKSKKSKGGWSVSKDQRMSNGGGIKKYSAKKEKGTIYIYENGVKFGYLKTQKIWNSVRKREEPKIIFYRLSDNQRFETNYTFQQDAFKYVNDTGELFFDITKKMSKGGSTWKEKYNKKYGYDKGTSHDLEEISDDTGVSEKGLQKIYNKGVGAFKTNPESVRPNVKSKEQWGMGRVYSAVMGGEASKIDANELKMSHGGGIVVDETIANNPMNEPKIGMAIIHSMDENEWFPNVYYVLDITRENGEIVAVTYGIPNGYSSGISVEQFKRTFIPATEKQVKRDKFTSKTLFEKGGQTEAQQEKIATVMREFKDGKLKTSYGETVTDEKQALAIALSKAGIEKKGNGGTVEEAMSLDELQTNFFNDNYYSSGRKWTTANFPKYIKHNGIVFEKGTPKKSNGLRKGQYIVSYYRDGNVGTDFFRYIGIGETKDEPVGSSDVRPYVTRIWETTKECFDELGVKSLSEADNKLDGGLRMIFKFFAQDPHYDGRIVDWFYEYNNRFVRGSGAETMSFIEYIPLMGDQEITVGSEERTEPLTHEMEEELKEIPTQKGTRQSPSESANSVSPNTVRMSDNDGQYYIAKETKGGYNQWKKFKGQVLSLGQPVTVNQVKGVIEGINPTEPEKYRVFLENGNKIIVDTSKTTINVLPKGTETKASTQKISGYEVGDKGIYNGKKPVPIEISKITGANVYFINEETGEQKRSQKENFERLFMPSALTGGTKPTELSEEEFIEHANEEIESWESKEPLEFKRTTPKLTPIEEIEVGDTIEFNLASNSPRFRAQVEEEESYGKFIKMNGKPYNGARFRLEQLMDIQKIEYLSSRKPKPESGEKPNYYNLFKTNYEVMEYQNNEVVAVVLESFVKMVDEDRLMSTENINEFDYIIDSLR